ncbi:MAG: hypothetical protein OEO19_08620 [Gammaproteobacteria bacterium]|nr:hypothetical protein [Gammaproteobacteria bacterium]MDH3446641.1 hypothetical protein [Gammaproteobacteria bacterium]
MRFSEVLLRLGCNLVGWLIIYSYFIWLGVIPQVSCGPEGAELYRLVLASCPVAILAAMLLGLAHPLTGVIDYLKWLALPLVILIPLSIDPIAKAMETATLGALDFCGPLPASDWQRAWAPVQIATVTIIVIAVARFLIRRRQVVA